MKENSVTIVLDAGYRKARRGKMFWARLVLDYTPDGIRAFYPFDHPLPPRAIILTVSEREWRRIMRLYKLKRVQTPSKEEIRERKRCRQNRWRMRRNERKREREREQKREQEKEKSQRQKVPMFIVQQVRNNIIRGTPTQMTIKIKELYGISLHRSTVSYYKNKKRRYRDRRRAEWKEQKLPPSEE